MGRRRRRKEPAYYHRKRSDRERGPAGVCDGGGDEESSCALGSPSKTLQVGAPAVHCVCSPHFGRVPIWGALAPTGEAARVFFGEKTCSKETTLNLNAVSTVPS